MRLRTKPFSITTDIERRWPWQVKQKLLAEALKCFPLSRFFVFFYNKWSSIYSRHRLTESVNWCAASKPKRISSLNHGLIKFFSISCRSKLLSFSHHIPWQCRDPLPFVRWILLCSVVIGLRYSTGYVETTRSILIALMLLSLLVSLASYAKI